MSNQPDFSLFEAAKEADAAYSAKLKTAYGRNACNMRYRPDYWNHPDEVQAARQRKHAADDTWFDHVATFRKNQS